MVARGRHSPIARLDLTDMQFGRWTVLGPAPSRDRYGAKWWRCRCECGQIRAVGGYRLRNGGSRSCGCLARELLRLRATEHGYARVGRVTPEFKVWSRMIDRCENRNHIAYARYGGRGITICTRWRNSFEAFLADMGPRPGPGYSIDRIDNDRGYELRNCRWATPKEQARNTQHNRMLTHDGMELCISQWAEETGLPLSTIQSRLNRGWSIERALTEPVRR